MTNYYERYWTQQADPEGVANVPPDWTEALLKRVLDFAAPHCSGRVLDLGCGEGFFTHNLSLLSAVSGVTGIDISETAVRRARDKYPHIDFRSSSTDILPFDDDSFDFVSMVEVVEHVVDVTQMFNEVSRVLKKGGRLLITTTDFNFLKKMIVAAFFWDRYFYPTNPHIRFFTKNTLKAVLKKSGLETVAYRWNGDYFHLMPKGQILIARKS